MVEIPQLVDGFFLAVQRGDVEIYNEFSLQHELGIHLRAAFGQNHKVQFERPRGFFGLTGDGYEKSEIDISIFAPDRSYRAAIELKFPRNGQHPEQMFKACQDIAFAEQLVAGGFDAAFFVMAADDPLFYRGDRKEGIYAHFRGGQTLTGVIRKPTGRKDESVSIRGSYSLRWHVGRNRPAYCIVTANPRARVEDHESVQKIYRSGGAAGEGQR